MSYGSACLSNNAIWVSLKGTVGRGKELSN
jgi:hypothetical protein